MLLRIGLISIGRQLSIGRCEKPTIITQQAAADSPRETVGAAGSSDVHRDCAWAGNSAAPERYQAETPRTWLSSSAFSWASSFSWRASSSR